jgi:hypothetical protein
MPVDAHPVEDGNVRVFIASNSNALRGVVMKTTDLRVDGMPRFKSHFATCPNSELHRRRGPK